MAILTIQEIVDVVIMSFLVGYIFSRYFSRFNPFRKPKDYTSLYALGNKFIWSDLLFSASLFAPAIILHELGHKFTALFFGLDATFHSPISIQHILNPFLLFTDFFALLMVIAVISTYFGSSFLFFVPAYVSFSIAATPFQQMLIAFAGPFVNLVLWLGSKWLIKSNLIKHKYVSFAIITSRINMFLFVFNMLPLPGFDGWKVYSGLFSVLFH